MVTISMTAKTALTPKSSLSKFCFCFYFTVFLQSSLFAASPNDTRYRSSQRSIAINKVLDTYLSQKSFEKASATLKSYLDLKEQEIENTLDASTRSKLEQKLLSDLFMIETAVGMTFKTNFSQRLFKSLRSVVLLPGAKKSRKAAEQYLVDSLIELLRQGPRTLLSKAVRTNSNYIAGEGFGNGKPTHQMSEEELGALAMVVEMSQDFVYRRQKRRGLRSKIYGMTAGKFLDWYTSKTSDTDKTGLERLQQEVSYLTTLFSQFQKNKDSLENPDFYEFRAWFVNTLRDEVKSRTQLREHLYRGGSDWHIVGSDIEELKMAIDLISGKPLKWNQNLAFAVRESLSGNRRLAAYFLKYGISNSISIAGILSIGAALVYTQYGVFHLDMPPSAESFVTRNQRFDTGSSQRPETADLTGDGTFDVRDAIERLNETPEQRIQRLIELDKKQEGSSQQNKN